MKILTHYDYPPIPDPRDDTAPQWTAEAKQAANFLASMPGGHTTLTTRDLRALQYQTGGMLMARGYLYDIRATSLGAGVWRVSLVMKNG